MRRAVLVFAFLFAPRAWAQDTTHAVRHWTTYEDLQLFSQVLSELRLNHPDSLDTHRLVMAAIDGMVHAADPHSFVIPAVRLNTAKEEAYRAGKLVPVPISFIELRGAYVVAGAASGSEAERLDILPGDRLVAIDSAPVRAQSVVELEVTLAGAPRTSTLLTVERRRLDGSTVRLDRRVTRHSPETESAVPAAFMLDARTGYARITTFLSDRAADDLHAALGELRHQGMQRLVLDLRDNGGGSIKQAAHVAGEFLPTGALIYTAEGRKKDVTDTGRVSRSFFSTAAKYPLVVMIDGGTASASELVAGALQDHDRAVIIGRPSFGKALLMVPIALSDGSSLMMVVGHIRTPCGRIVQRTYRGVSLRDYYEGAWSPRDTAGQPSCKTDAGRTVYGGGGIVPDILLPTPPGVPAWLEQVNEDRLILQWIGGYVGAHGAELTTLDAFAALPALPAALGDFRAFAASHGDSIPSGATADQILGRVLSPAVADAKWGEPGYYRIVAVLDPDVTAASHAFDRAATLLR
jgi:carboxyl-terminal processing protease